MAGKAKILTSKEIENVFKLLKTNRDRTIFGLGLFTAMRITEIISLQQEQVFTDGGVKNKITVKRLKRRKTVYTDIPMHSKLRELLKVYKKDIRDSTWLFPKRGKTNGHITRARAHDILTEAFKALKLDGAKTHSMRRSCLTIMSRNGVQLRTIQEISGHKNLGQLQEYLDTDPKDTYAAINKIKY